MVNYFISNGTASALTDVNAAGSDVAAYGTLDAVTLTATELLAVLTTAAVLVTKTAPTSAQRRMAGKVFRLDCNPGA